MNRKRACLLAAILAAAVPAGAQDTAPPEGRGDLAEGADLLEQGARLLLRGLMQELGPALREMESGLRELEALIGDLSLYHAPEVLPNGDILIRRKAPLPVVPDPGADPAPGGEIDL